MRLNKLLFLPILILISLSSCKKESKVDQAAADKKIIHPALYRQIKGPFHIAQTHFIRVKKDGQLLLLLLFGRFEGFVNGHKKFFSQRYTQRHQSKMR